MIPDEESLRVLQSPLELSPFTLESPFVLALHRFTTETES